MSLAAAVLACALLALTGAAAGASFVTDRAAHTAQRSGELADDYSSARFWLESERRLDLSYRNQPTPPTRSGHVAAKIAVDTAMRSVARHGFDSDRDIARTVLVNNDDYAASSSQLFAEVDAGAVAAQDHLDQVETDPIFEGMEAVVYQQSNRQRNVATQAERRLLRAEKLGVLATSGAIGTGLLLILVFAVLRYRYSRRSDEHDRLTTYRATHDALTGLPNRVLFAQLFDVELAKLADSGGTIAVGLLDLDRFKDVNDTFGHHFGDRLLQQIGPRIGEVLCGRTRLARLGGDEFAVLITLDTDGDIAEVEQRLIMQCVLDALRTPFIVDGVSLVVEASAGMAHFPQDGNTGALLLQRADIAMYVAKANHQDLVLYDASHDTHDWRKLALLADLHHAVPRNEFVLHYQPLIDIGTDTVHGVEALIRWQHPTKGLLFPGDFIDLAEGSGFIHELTRWVLHHALTDAATWARHSAPLVVSVNISARCLLDATLPDTVAGILSNTGVPTTQVKLEITESAIMADPVRANDVINRLHDLGIALSIDDFGTGYTSLAYLRDLPVQELKIDKSFVTHMLTKTKDAAIVRTAVELAHRLGLDIVAEGIEDAAVLTELRVLGCTTAQGYHLSRPLPKNQLLAWINTWNTSNSQKPWSHSTIAVRSASRANHASPQNGPDHPRSTTTTTSDGSAPQHTPANTRACQENDTPTRVQGLARSVE